jgi:benzoate-CoA ligase
MANSTIERGGSPRAERARGVKRERALIFAGRRRLAVALPRRDAGGGCSVAVNTLLTADDLAYMLEHSRPSRVVARGQAAEGRLRKSDHGSTQSSCRALHSCSSGRNRVQRLPRQHVAAVDDARARDDPAFGFLVRLDRRKGTVHSHANPYHRALRQGDPPGRKRAIFASAAKLFFAYGLGNADISARGRRDGMLMAERPTPVLFKR